MWLKDPSRRRLAVGALVVVVVVVLLVSVVVVEVDQVAFPPHSG